MESDSETNDELHAKPAEPQPGEQTEYYKEIETLINRINLELPDDASAASDDESQTEPSNLLFEKTLYYKELENLMEIVGKLEPPESEIIRLKGINAYGQSLQMNGAGGDHITWVD